MRRTPEEYAMNQDNAEKASNHPDGTSAAAHNARATSPGLRGEAGGGGTSVKSKNVETESHKPRSDAKIWSLYLTEAEKEAKERAELWKTDLESLLVFAGLFAGVVASFVIDSRRDLQPDPQQVLLADIRNALRNETATQDTFIPSASSLWINGLWFASLLITLFSAIMGVLAKAWLAKFVPVASGQESNDAYQRWIRDEKANIWYLEKVITTAPFLIQLALFLFSLGFGLQSVGDNPTLGWVVLSSVILASIMYIIITVLPLLSPWCPFQTPLSDLLLSLSAFYRSTPPPKSASLAPKDGARTYRSRRDEPNEIDVLSEIWHNKLIKSAKPSNVDEAIAELTRAELNDIWWKRFVEWETPMILRGRLQKSITFKGQRGSRDDILCNHLLALSGFVDYFERSEPGKLSTSLGAFLDPENPLHRWNIFPEQFRALAFSVRTPILLACRKDHTLSEMDERPWEAMVHDMLPSHRQGFAMAMCRGLVGDQERLRKVSALSIVVCIAKASGTAVAQEIGWAAEVDAVAKDKTQRLVPQFLRKLFKEIATGWKTMVVKSLNSTSSVAVNPDSRDIMMPGSLGSELRHSNPNVRNRVIETLLTLAQDAAFIDYVESTILGLVEMVVKDPEQDVRANGMVALTSLARDEKLRGIINLKIPESLKSAFQNSYWLIRLRVMETLVVLQSHNFQDMVQPAIPMLIEMVMSDEDDDVRIAGMKTLDSLVQNYILRDTIIPALPKILNTARVNIRSSSCTSWIRLLLVLAEKTDFWDSIKSAIPTLLAITTNNTDIDVHDSGIQALASLAADELLRDYIKLALPNVLKSALEDPGWEIRINAIKTLVALFENPIFRDVAKTVIPKLVEVSVNDSDYDVCAAGMKSFTPLTQGDDATKISILESLEYEFKNARWPDRIHVFNTLGQNSDFRDAVQSAIPKLVEMAVKDNDEDVRIAGLEAMAPLVQDGGLRGIIEPAVLNILGSAMKDPHWRVRAAGLKMLVILAQNSNVQDSVESAIPEFVDMVMNDNDEDVRAVGMKTMASLAQNSKFQSIIKPGLMKIIDSSSNHTNWQVRAAWVEIQVTLSQNSDFQVSVESGIPKLGEMAMNDDNEGVRVAGVKSLASLARDDKLRAVVRDSIKSVLSKSLELALKNSDWQVRTAWIEMLIILARIPDFQDNVQSTIPQLIDIAVNDEDEDVRGTVVKGLTSLAKDKKLQGAIIQALPKSPDSVFRDSELCSDWGQVLGTLTDCDLQLGGAAEPAILKIVEMAVKDDDKGVCDTMVKFLASLTKDAKLRDIGKSALSKNFDSGLKDPNWQLRINAINALSVLVPHSDFQDTVKSAIPQLLKTAVIDKGEEDVLTRAAGVKLLESLPAKDFGDTILLAVPPSIALVTPEGHNIQEAIDKLLRFVKEPKISERTTKSMADKLTSMLKESSWLTRATAVEFLAVLKEYKAFRQFIQSAIPEVIALVLKDKEDDVRAAGIRSLVNLAGEGTFQLAEKITIVMPQLMPLLEIKRLRAPTVELISLLADDGIVREAVVSHIIPLIATKTSKYSDGLLELLLRLIMDKRFSCGQASDHVVLSVGSVLLMRPQSAKFRLQIATALWCNYGDMYLGTKHTEKFEDKLVNLLIFTVFGHHVTLDEVEKWCCSVMGDHLPRIE